MWIPSIWTGSLLPAHCPFPFIDMLVDGLGLMLLMRILLCRADFHTVSSSCFLQPFSELMQFFTASQKICIISQPHVAKQSPSDCHWAVKVFCIIFSRNILNSTRIIDIFVVLLLSFEISNTSILQHCTGHFIIQWANDFCQLAVNVFLSETRMLFRLMLSSMSAVRKLFFYHLGNYLS